MQRKVKSAKLQSFLIVGLLMIGMLLTACEGFEGQQQQQQPIEGGAITEPPGEVQEAEEAVVVPTEEVTEAEEVAGAPTEEPAEAEEVAGVPTEEPAEAEEVAGVPTEEPAGAVQEQAATEQQQQQQMSQAGLKASALVGQTVQNNNGEELGDIEDLVMGLDNGQIRYAILSTGGFLELGEELFAIPVSAFQFDEQQQTLMLNVTEETLQNAPGFAQDAWPEMGSMDWDADVQQFWQENMPEAMTGQGQQMQQAQQTGMAVRASEVLDYNVHDMQGQPIGQVEDLIVDLQQGQVNFAVLTFDEAAATGADPNMLYAIQMNELQADQQQQAFQYNFDQASLQNVPSFSQDQWNEDQLQVQIAMMQQPGQMEQQQQQQASRTQQQQMMISQSALKASALMNRTVQNSNGDELGEIEDVMINLRNGEIRFAILGAGGFLGLGERLIVAPVNAFQFDPQQETFILDIDEQTLENAPSFGRDEWPTGGDPEWDAQVQQFWQENMPEAMTGQDQQMQQGQQQIEGTVRASEMMDYSLQDMQGQEIGQLQDLAVNLDENKVDAIIVSLNEEFGDPNSFYALQIDQLQADIQQQLFQYTQDVASLQNAPSFPQDQWDEDQIQIASLQQQQQPEQAQQQQQQAVTPQQQQQQEMSQSALKASALIGRGVQNNQGEDLGEVEDLMLDLNSGQIKRVVLSSGEFLDIGGEAETISPDALQFDRQQDAFVLDQESTAAQMGTRASEVLDYTLQDAQGQSLGQVEDLVVNMTRGQVEFVVVSLDENIGETDRWYAIRFNELNPDAQQQQFVYQQDQTSLQNMPSFTQEEWAEDQVSVNAQQLGSIAQ